MKSLVGLTKQEFESISEFAFSKLNPGYKPNVIEAPNGDGRWDTEKKYAHVAPKYFKDIKEDISSIVNLYDKAVTISNGICEKLNIPEKYWAGSDSTLRVLHYPPGATTTSHTDFDLFTISMYRNSPELFKYLSGEDDPLLKKARAISPGLHFGELMSEINESKATEHEVMGSTDWQYSAVFFVVPHYNSILPSGISVGEWIDERKNRSRVTRIGNYTKQHNNV